MGARQPIEDIEASLLAATKSALGPSQSHMGWVTCAVPLTLTTDNGQQESVRPGGGAGPRQLRSKADLAGESAAGAKRSLWMSRLPPANATQPEQLPLDGLDRPLGPGLHKGKRVHSIPFERLAFAF
jgi:hypothetical protein